MGGVARPVTCAARASAVKWISDSRRRSLSLASCAPGSALVRIPRILGQDPVDPVCAGST